MVADVNDDIEAEPTLCDDRVVQSVKEDRHQGFEVGTLATRDADRSPGAIEWA